VTDIKIQAWRTGIACLGMLAAVSVYCFARLYPPGLLGPLQATRPDLASLKFLFGSAPSLFYTLSIGLMVGACSSSLSGARLHCALWTGMAVCLEMTQHPVFAESLTALLAEMLPRSTWELVGPYWTRGAFDQLDLVATVLGGSIALAVLAYLPMRNNR
jgi:hypothetical protein